MGDTTHRVPLPSQIGGRKLLPVDDPDHLVEARIDPTVEIPLAQQRNNGFRNDAVGSDVSEHTLQPPADLNAQIPIILGNNEQRAVVDLLAPELPLIDHAD